MPSKLKEFIEQGKWKQMKKSDWAVLALVGILLLVVAMPSGQREKANDSGTFAYADAEGENGGQQGSGMGSGTAGSKASDMGQEEYVEYLEEKLSGILSQMDGVGKVEVMITVSDAGESVVEKDKKTQSTVTSENDSGGGSRTVTESSSENATIYIETEAGTYPYIQKEKLPTVEGVVVVAEGGGNPTVVSEISESVKALLKVEAHRIRVVKMCSKEE